MTDAERAAVLAAPVVDMSDPHLFRYVVFVVRCFERGIEAPSARRIVTDGESRIELRCRSAYLGESIGDADEWLIRGERLTSTDAAVTAASTRPVVGEEAS